jgi:hypothetical protein
MTQFHSFSNLKSHGMGKRIGLRLVGGTFNRLPMQPSRF